MNITKKLVSTATDSELDNASNIICSEINKRKDSKSARDNATLVGRYFVYNNTDGVKRWPLYTKVIKANGPFLEAVMFESSDSRTHQSYFHKTWRKIYGYREISESAYNKARLKFITAVSNI